MSPTERVSVPTEVLEIARTLEEAGFEAWCVGGALRDALLGDPTRISISPLRRVRRTSSGSFAAPPPSAWITARSA